MKRVQQQYTTLRRLQGRSSKRHTRVLWPLRVFKRHHHRVHSSQQSLRAQVGPQQCFGSAGIVRSSGPVQQGRAEQRIDDTGEGAERGQRLEAHVHVACQRCRSKRQLPRKMVPSRQEDDQPALHALSSGSGHMRSHLCEFANPSKRISTGVMRDRHTWSNVRASAWPSRTLRTSTFWASTQMIVSSCAPL